MTYTKPQTVNVVKGKNVQAPYTHDTSKLQKVFIAVRSTGETARGIVNLVYENCRVQIEYDTVVGPDGLLTTIDTQVDDLARTKVHDDYVYTRITEDMINAAKKALSENRTEAIQHNGHGIINAQNYV